jgi:two-component system sensor histidine kinase RegB
MALGNDLVAAGAFHKALFGAGTGIMQGGMIKSGHRTLLAAGPAMEIRQTGRTSRRRLGVALYSGAPSRAGGSLQEDEMALAYSEAVSGGERVPADLWESRLRLQTTVRLRWFAVIGQTLAVAFVALGLGFPVPLGYCLAIIACSAWLNVFLRLRYSSRWRLGTRLASALLIYDTLQLSALLYLTGGIGNPFVLLLVAPVTVSAATLPPRNTVLIGAVAFACSTLLVAHHLPLPWNPDFAGSLSIPVIYSLGTLTAIAATLAFLALYTWRLAKESRQMSAALAATEMVLAHEQKLHALDGLAAAAAHELGTPLATIVLVTKELGHHMPKESPYRDDIDLLNSQALRCRELLQKLTKSPAEQDPLHAHLSVVQLLDEASGPYRTGRVEIAVDAGPSLLQGGEVQGGREPIGNRLPGVIHGLGNIIENAVDFARERVEIIARWNDREVTIMVADDGPGFTPEILESIGEPYITTRPNRPVPRPGGLGQPRPAHAGGLGLGVFIAKTLLERSGAVVTFANRAGSGSGAMVHVAWPRRVFEATSPGWAQPRSSSDDLAEAGRAASNN